MSKTDLYEKLIKFYDSIFGRLPNRQEFKQAVQETLTEKDIKVIFLVPFGKGISLENLEKKASRANISRQQLHQIIERLLPEGFLASYVRPERVSITGVGYDDSLSFFKKKPLTGPIVKRMGVLLLTEIQVRKQNEDAMHRASAHWMDAMIEDAGRSQLYKTPPKRALPTEKTITQPQNKIRIEIGESIPDHRTVLPFDILSEMLKKEDIIAVADCYCRSTKNYLGQGCDHPLKTCFYFDEIALLQISSGRAERINYEQAIQIIRECEDAGLIHMVDNNRDRIGVLCNCCACACPIIKSRLLGGTHISATSRYIISHDDSMCLQCGICVDFCQVKALALGDKGLEIDYERCIGCGVCVSKCPENSMRLVLRENQPRLAKNSSSLHRRIAAEFLLGKAKSWITGKG